MATVYNARVEGDAPQAMDTPAIFRKSRVIDFADHPLVVTNDVSVFDIPAGAVVLGVGLDVLTANGGALTGDVGITGTLNQFLDDVDLDVAAAKYLLVADTKIKSFAAASILTFTSNGTTVAGKVRVWMAYLMLTPDIFND